MPLPARIPGFAQSLPWEMTSPQKTGEISEATFYNWKKKYGGFGVSELRRLKQLEEENSKLRQIVHLLLIPLPSFGLYYVLATS